MAFLGDVSTHGHGPHTGVWRVAGTEDYTSRWLFEESFHVPLGRADNYNSRYLLAELSIHNVPDHGCSARVRWNVVTTPVNPGRPPPLPRAFSVYRDGARILVPADPLVEPIFCIFHRFGDVVLSPRILVTIQFYQCAAQGVHGSRRIAVSVGMGPLPHAQFAWSTDMVTMQMHAFETAHSAGEDSEGSEDDDEENAMLQNGVLAETLSSGEEDAEEPGSDAM